jgi:hypothetical protein
MTTKKCCTCKTVKTYLDFHKSRGESDGLQNECKECKKKFASSPKREKINLEIRRRYARSEKGKKKYQLYSRRRREKYPEICKAQGVVNRSVKKGTILSARCFNCFKCGKQAEAYHHHLGYSPEHWLDVVPVCKKCHVIIHYEKKG